MKKKSASRSVCSHAAAVDSKKGTARHSSCVHVTAGGATIDFLSPEFNRTDELYDSPRSARTFEPLGDVITADMHHQEERRRKRDGGASCAAIPVPQKQSETKPDPDETVEEPSSLTVVSWGRTLIIDTDGRRAVACGTSLAARALTCTLLLTDAAAAVSPIPGIGRFSTSRADAVSVAGAFGGFSATVTAGGEQTSLTGSADGRAATFDLVLDLRPVCSYAGSLLPPGYYAPGTDPVRLREAMDELPGMRGRFVRPQYTVHQKSRCIHGRRRVRDCLRCTEVCPFGAIRSADRAVTINPYLCQGCGACSLVCPADAIRTFHPSPEDLLERMRDALGMNAPGAGFPATVVISDSETVPIRNRPGGQDMRPDGPRHFDVEQIGHVGAELILAARAFGAGTVLVVRGPQTHPAIEKALDAQIRMADAILHGLGMQAGNDRFGAATARAPSPGGTAAATDSGTRPESPSSPPTSIPRCPDRNMQLRLLAQHLYERAGVKEPSISLPAGSPFGSVAVDSSRCSLCMACALACPSLALSAGGDVPRLMFQESRCHQCGLCEEVCPEGAIRRQSRMLCDRDAAEKKAVLAEAIPFRCIECGDPFASPALIDRIRTKLDGHRMYSDERQRRRLQMCRTCRTRDALSSQEMRSWIES